MTKILVRRSRLWSVVWLIVVSIEALCVLPLHAETDGADTALLLVGTSADGPMWGVVNRNGDVLIKPGEVPMVWTQSAILLSRLPTEVVIKTKSGDFFVLDAEGHRAPLPFSQCAAVKPFGDGWYELVGRGRIDSLEKPDSRCVLVRTSRIDGRIEARQVIACAEANEFVEGFATVMVDAKWGVLGRDGHWVVEPSYDKLAARFSEGKLLACRDDVRGFLDKQGEWVLKLPPGSFGDVGEFHQGVCRLRTPDHQAYYHIDEQGDPLYAPRFLNVGDFSGGVAPAQDSVSKRWGMIDKSGEYQVMPEYEFAGACSKGLIPVLAKGGRWQVVDTHGELAFSLPLHVSPNWETFIDGLLCVENTKDNFTSYITSDGTYQWKPDDE